MKRKNSLYSSPEFWENYIKSELFSVIEDYMINHKLNRSGLAAKLGFSKGYISQILKGSGDHKISKLVELSTAIGKAPYIYFKDLDNVIESSENGKSVYLDFNRMEDLAEECDSASGVHPVLQHVSEPFGSRASVIEFNDCLPSKKYSKPINTDCFSAFQQDPVGQLLVKG